MEHEKSNTIGDGQQQESVAQEEGMLLEGFSQSIKNGDIGPCVLIFEGNVNTKKSYLYMSIPLKHVTQAINEVVKFEHYQPIFVEIVNDEEFAAAPEYVREVGYGILEGRRRSRAIYKIVIPEANANEITSFVIKGFMTIYMNMPGRESCDGHKIYDDINKAVARIR